MIYVLNHRLYQKFKLVGKDNSMLKELLLSLLFSQVVVMSINLYDKMIGKIPEIVYQDRSAI
jgi:hypothetical protein